MRIEKPKLKMFNTISIIILAAMLLTIIGGLMIQQQSLPERVDIARVRAGNNPMPMQPEMTQTSPTGRLVVNTGIILLTIGFIMITLILVGRNRPHRNTS